MLRRTRKQIDAGDHPAAGEELDKAFLELVGTGVEAVSRLSETELLARLTMEGPTHVVREKALILVALLQQAGEIHAAAEAGHDERDEPGHYGRRVELQRARCRRAVVLNGLAVRGAAMAAAVAIRMAPTIARVRMTMFL